MVERPRCASGALVAIDGYQGFYKHLDIIGVGYLFV